MSKFGIGQLSFQQVVVRGSVIVLVVSFLGSVFAYLVRILYSHTLTIEDYGLFYAVMGLFLIFTTYLDLGFGYSVVYLLPKYLRRKDYTKAWSIFIYGQGISLVMSVLISSLMIAFAPLLAKYYFKVPGSEILIYIFCVYLVAFSLINGLMQIYSGMQKPQYYSSITLFRWLLSFVISLVFVAVGVASVIVFAVALVIGHLATSLIYFGLLHHRHSFLTTNKITWEKETLKHMFSLALPSLLDTLIASVLVMAGTFFLTLFKGVREVGIYNIIFPLASIPIVLVSPLNTLMLPLVSHLMEGERKKLRYLTERILRIVPFVGAYFCLFIFLFPSASVGLIFGEKWIGSVEVPLQVLCIGAVAILTSGVLGAMVLGAGRVKERLKISAVITVVGSLVNGLMIWAYGIMGAAVATALLGFVTYIVFVRILRGAVSFGVPYGFYLKVGVFSLLLFGIVRLLNITPRSWPEFLTLGIVYSMLYMLLGYSLKIFDKKVLLMVFRK